MTTIPIPDHLTPLPPRLTMKQVRALVIYWNLGTRRYVDDLRACGVLSSVTPFPSGRRARYDTAAVLRLYDATSARNGPQGDDGD